MVRRLPVIQAPPSEDAEAEARPEWQWVLIGAGMLVVTFMPLSAVGLWIGGAGPLLVAYACAGLAAGALIGRFGVRTRRSRIAWSGALGGFTVLLLAGLGGALSPWPVALGAALVLLGGGALFALLGSFWGRRRSQR